MNPSNEMSPEKDGQIRGPILALDLGLRRVGVALSDELMISIRRLDSLNRSNWKQLLRDVADLAQRFDARTLVIGLPLSMDGRRGSAAQEIQLTAEKFSRSLDLPVFLQDERLTTIEARERLRAEGLNPTEISKLIDSEAAAVILRDFIAQGLDRPPVTTT